jgi:hypothetical protein
VVAPERFELSTAGLGNRRSIHLSYRAISDKEGYSFSLSQS